MWGIFTQRINLFKWLFLKEEGGGNNGGGGSGAAKEIDVILIDLNESNLIVLKTIRYQIYLNEKTNEIILLDYEKLQWSKTIFDNYFVESVIKYKEDNEFDASYYLSNNKAFKNEEIIKWIYIFRDFHLKRLLKIEKEPKYYATLILTGKFKEFLYSYYGFINLSVFKRFIIRGDNNDTELIKKAYLLDHITNMMKQKRTIWYEEKELLNFINEDSTYLNIYKSLLNDLIIEIRFKNEIAYCLLSWVIIKKNEIESIDGINFENKDGKPPVILNKQSKTITYDKLMPMDLLINQKCISITMIEYPPISFPQLSFEELNILKFDNQFNAFKYLYTKTIKCKTFITLSCNGKINYRKQKSLITSLFIGVDNEIKNLQIDDVSNTPNLNVKIIESFKFDDYLKYKDLKPDSFICIFNYEYDFRWIQLFKTTLKPKTNLFLIFF